MATRCPHCVMWLSIVITTPTMSTLRPCPPRMPAPQRTHATCQPVKAMGDDVRVFYADLTEYDYLDDDVFIDQESGFYGLRYRPAYPRLNVGWLQAGKPYPTGTVPAAFAEKLTAVQK